MSPRRHITLKTKLASALLALGHVPYLDAKQMSADQLISLYQWHHNMRHADDGTDHFSNLEPLLITAHREQTAKIDAPAMAKDRKIGRAVAAHQTRMVAKIQGEPKPPSRWAKGRKIASRGFQR